MMRILLTLLVPAVVLLGRADAAQNGAVIGWGNNSWNLTNVPPGLTNCVAVSASASHALVLDAAGLITAWGRSSEGQTTIPANLTNVQAISAGDNFSLVLSTDGTVTAYGKYWDTGSYIP